MPKSKRGRRSLSNSGFIGVGKNADGLKYMARIYINCKAKIIGSYDTAKQAAKAHDKAAIKLRRPLAKLNYPNNAPVGYTPIQKAVYSNNTVGYKGVYIHRKKFLAQIRIDGKTTHIGTYDTAQEAAVAYDHAVLNNNLSPSLLNFPQKSVSYIFAVFCFHNPN